MAKLYWIAGILLAAIALIGAAATQGQGVDLAGLPNALTRVAESVLKSGEIKADEAAPKAEKAAPAVAPTQAATQGKNGSAKGKGSQGPVTVETASARASTSTTDIRAIGSLQSDESVQIASEIAGRIAEVSFQEGTQVKEGAILFKLDDVLAKAEVADASARFALAQANVDRAKALSRTGNVTDKARDEAVASFESGTATLELAKARLEKHTIRAPFSGSIGTRKVSAGAYVGIGVALVNLEKIDTLKVDFKVPELFLSSVAVGQKIEIKVDALPDQSFTGEIYTIDPMVDVNGRALRIRARLANPELVLRPGLFARILIIGSKPREVVLVPESAVVPRGGETFVFTVENGKAKEIKVKLGERRGAEVEIVEGIESESIVVTAGQLRLRNGSAVEALSMSNGNGQPRVKRGS